MSQLVVGLGEVLWDVFPGESLLGGAPANVAYHASTLGHIGVVASRIGDDERGNELASALSEKKVETRYIQTDDLHPTGTVQVTFVEGDPRYEIVRDVAWDYLEWTPQWQELAETCSAVCFSTLAQRNTQSRATIQRFLRGTSSDCLRVLDVNLRPPFINEDILKTSIECSNVVKYNYQEALYLKRLFRKDNLESWLCEDMGIDLVCVTRGAEGCELVRGDNRVSLTAEAIETSNGDPVGAGDAFSAAVIDGLLKGWSLEEVARRANRYAGLVASKKGGMPAMPEI